ncbi:MAG: peptidase M61 [Snowella sp.]|jgi:predicted metalloprotease with PDZ domain|nr:MAG: peptidase M61 [Snowella sp.]
MLLSQTVPQSSSLDSTLPRIVYQVSMPQPTSHLFEVTLTIEHWQERQLNLKMPVWTPGSYLVREYSRNLQDFIPQNSHTKARLIFEKSSKNHWQIETEDATNITIFYRVYAHELSVRTNHLDDSHGYFNGAALFLYIPGLESSPSILEIIPPQANWKVTTPLRSLEGKKNTFLVPDFDTLVDSPVEVGTHPCYEFQVRKKNHQLAIWGEGNIDAEKVIRDMEKIIEVEADLYGGLPYENYSFLLHLSNNGFGGLEHKNSCTLNYSRFGFRDPEKYNRFIQLVAHEFFHLWNVKRIRPQALEKFDYEQENYTPSLWFSEGTTSYYDLLIPLRAGLYNSKIFLDNLGKEITRFLVTPGRMVQPLAESSFDAWIKLYRRDANSDNSQMSYYLKGELVSLLLDLLIRDRTENQRSLDDVMRQMWEKFGKTEIGFTENQLKEVIESVADRDLTDFFQKYLHTTQELPFNDYLEPFGLRLQAVPEDNPIPHTGMRVQSENGKDMIKFVAANSPAQVAGISPDDELLALDGIRVTAEQLPERLKDYQANDMIELSVFHQDVLKTVQLQLAISQPSRYEVVRIPNPSDRQVENIVGWLGSN